MTDQQDNKYYNEGNVIGNNSHTSIDESFEGFKPYNISYDGSNVVSSQPFETAFNTTDFDESCPEGKQSNEPESKMQVEAASTDVTEEPDLAEKNKELNEQLARYEAFLSELFKIKNNNDNTQTPDVQHKPLTPEEIYNIGKHDALVQSLYRIKQQAQFNAKVSEIRKNNADILCDPIKEEVVSCIAARYIQSGLDFDSSVARAMNDFRNVFNQNNSNSKINNGNTKSSEVHNSPRNQSYQIKMNPSAFYIEGASRSTSEKYFKSSELIDMQINRPDEYLRLQPQIMRAYEKGRVTAD